MLNKLQVSHELSVYVYGNPTTATLFYCDCTDYINFINVMVKEQSLMSFTFVTVTTTKFLSRRSGALFEFSDKTFLLMICSILITCQLDRL